MPYTYVLTHKPSGRRYYGVRYAKESQPSDLFVTYFSSSKHVLALIKQDGIESFSYEVRRVFDCPDKARAWEFKVLTRLRCVQSKAWINAGSCLAPAGPKTPEHIEKIAASRRGKTGNRKGVKLSEESKFKMREARLKFYARGGKVWNEGRSMSEETKAKLRANNGCKPGRILTWCIGKKLSDEHRAKISAGVKRARANDRLLRN